MTPSFRVVLAWGRAVDIPRSIERPDPAQATGVDGFGACELVDDPAAVGGNQGLCSHGHRGGVGEPVNWLGHAAGGRRPAPNLNWVAAHRSNNRMLLRLINGLIRLPGST
jgi:hypothetical protein